jgi:hypothetical protein
MAGTLHALLVSPYHSSQRFRSNMQTLGRMMTTFGA